MNEDETEKRKCPECKGSGYVVLLVSRHKCDVCGGTGFVAVEKDGAEEKKRTPSRWISKGLSDMSGRSFDSSDEESTIDDPDYALEFDDQVDLDDEYLWYEALD